MTYPNTLYEYEEYILLLGWLKSLCFLQFTGIANCEGTPVHFCNYINVFFLFVVSLPISITAHMTNNFRMLRWFCSNNRDFYCYDTHSLHFFFQFVLNNTKYIFNKTCKSIIRVIIDLIICFLILSNLEKYIIFRF